jgi:glutaredoxin 3
MSKIEVYTTGMCPYCYRAKKLLDGKGVSYDEIDVMFTPGKRDEMIERSGRRTVPQIFVGDTHVGGYDDLAALDQAGKLDPLLQTA